MQAMKLRIPKALAVGAVAAAMLATTGCGGILGGGGDKTADSGPIKIAAVIPMSGSSAPTGVYMKNGMQMAVDEINAKGGVLGRQLSLDLEDGACDPTQAAAAANKAVSNGAVISVGGYCSGATLPTLPIFAKANIPMIIPAANSQELVNQKLPNVFMINGTGSQQAAAAVKFMAKDGVKSVALVDDNTSYSKDIATETKKDLQADGTVKVALATSVTAGESDYSSAVHDIMGANPDMLYWTGYYQEGGLIINQLKAAGYKGKIMVADGSVDPSLVKIAGAANAEGVFATMTQTPDTIKGAETWIANYTKAFGSAPGPYSTQSYDAVRVAAEAMTQAKGTGGDAVIKALAGIDGFQIFSGPLKFTPEHTLSSGGFQILVVQGGKFILKDALA
ncbi:branched-chain amino acid ABC transporter substrate-binding protein [Arthrobacter livingstonensis]|uniref:Branched-chain amino acid ABC transporter substrate-binding protein n=2 Tax=Arthrobacter livingstonensis TaxID=670078 RepID=A0A2V5LX60_9MICC|nr:branched-chain amino acid ABC transporter substrate-binding protein [Arthrobacter livingstonensis]